MLNFISNRDFGLSGCSKSSENLGLMQQSNEREDMVSRHIFTRSFVAVVFAQFSRPSSLPFFSTSDNNFGTLIPSCIFILAFEIIGNFTGRDLKRVFSP